MLLSIIVWIVSMVCGVILAENKGYSYWGFVITFLLGPLGLLIVACLPNKKHEEEEEEKRLLLQQQLHFQRLQMEQSNALAISKINARPPPPGSKKLQIAKDGKDLGEMSIGMVKTMLADGRLTMEDFYFDAESNEWFTLDCHPALS